MFGPDDAGGEADDEPTVPAELAASWRSAETQLFGAVLDLPDLYRGVVAMVGDTLDQLRRLGPTPTALLNAAPTIGALVRDGLQAPGPAGPIDPDLIGRAALAVRHREVAAEQASARRVRLLAAARARHLSWVVLEESGDWAGDQFMPYRRLEAHATTGQALLVTAGPDDDFRTCQHAVERLRVDVHTGRVGEPGSPDGGPFRCRLPADREAHAEALRAILGRSG
jgi:hypothetical protein